MENIKAFAKKLMYAISANAISLMVSLATTFLLPKFFGDRVDQYGYLQVYLFYITYTGFFHFGLCDGIYLRDAGKSYDSLDKALYSAQFWLLVLFEGIIALAVGLIGVAVGTNDDYRFIWLMIAISIIIVLPRTMIQYFLQTTNRIKEYSTVITIERAIYGVSLVCIFLGEMVDFRIVVLADLTAKLLSLCVSIFFVKDIILTKPCKIQSGLNECKINVSVGSKLMFANIASMLINGIVQWGIQQNWNVATYGKIAFSLNVSNFLLTFISAVAVVLYPTLRRMSFEKLPGIYQTIRSILMIPLLGCLALYYPIKQLLSAWLPQYADSLHYMAILFPLCIYAAKMTMLVQTYMNVYRMEKSMLKVNCVGVVVAVLTMAISVFVLNNLTFAMVSIVINQMFRCIYAELVLSKKIEISVRKDVVLEAILTMAFILSNWYVGGLSGVGIYFVIYVVYCIVEKKKIITMCRFLRGLLHASQA